MGSAQQRSPVSVLIAWLTPARTWEPLAAPTVKRTHCKTDSREGGDARAARLAVVSILWRNQTSKALGAGQGRDARDVKWSLAFVVLEATGAFSPIVHTHLGFRDPEQRR